MDDFSDDLPGRHVPMSGLMCWLIARRAWGDSLIAAIVLGACAAGFIHLIGGF
jgi:hypothetical protein